MLPKDENFQIVIHQLTLSSRHSVLFEYVNNFYI